MKTYRYRLWIAPSAKSGPFTTPPGLRDLGEQRLAPLKDRAAAYRAYRLFVWLLRWHGAPPKIDPATKRANVRVFPLDRAVLSLDADLGLTESEIRTAIRVLVRVGLIDRLPGNGSAFQVVGGRPTRKPIQYRLSFDVRAVINHIHLLVKKYKPKRKKIPEGVLPGEDRRHTPQRALERRALDSAPVAPSGVKMPSMGLNPALEGAAARILAEIRRRQNGVRGAG